MRSFAIAFTFLTRWPWGAPERIGPADLARASRCYPWVGALVGLWIGACFLLARTVMPPLLAATLAIAAGILGTGALHEDGLGDLADAFGGGHSPERKLEIMKDSRQGAYGVLAIVLSLLVRIQALAWLPPNLVLPVLVAIAALSRVGMVWLLWLLPAARPGGLAAANKGVSVLDVGISTGGAMLLAGVCLGAGAVVPVLTTFVALLLVGWLGMRHISGITGDVLGSAQQIAEIGGLLALGALAQVPAAIGYLSPLWLRW